MEEWKSYRLGDIASVQTGPFGSQLHNEDYVPVGTPIVTVEHLGARKFSEQNLPLVSDEDRVRLDKYSLKEGDIVFSRVGSVDRCSYVSSAEGGWLFSGRCLRVRSSNLVYPLYLYYYFQKESVKQEIRNVAVGATMPSINTKLLSDLTLSIPCYSEQKRIASMLSSIDDKIELNNRINHNLEEQAQALYKSWFVDFEPFKDGAFVDSEFGMIPEGWRVGSIYDICDVYYGAPFNSTLFNSEKKGFPLIRIRDFAKQEAGVFTEEIHPKGQLSKKGDILVGMDGEFSIYIWGGVPSWINQRITRFTPKRGVSHYFLSETLRPQLKAVETSEVATTVIHIGKNDYDKFRSIIPTPKVMESFYSLSEPLFSQFVDNLSGNQELAKLRETLLPRLMSGSIQFDC